jgi:hypothetical protein
MVENLVAPTGTPRTLCATRRPETPNNCGWVVSPSFPHMGLVQCPQCHCVKRENRAFRGWESTESCASSEWQTRPPGASLLPQPKTGEGRGGGSRQAAAACHPRYSARGGRALCAYSTPNAERDTGANTTVDAWVPAMAGKSALKPGLPVPMVAGAESSLKNAELLTTMANACTA